MVKLTEQEIEDFDDNADTAELLECVDSIDTLRRILRSPDNIAPPQIRDDLLKIHTMLFDGLKQFNGDMDDELPNLLINVIEDLETLVTEANAILEVLRKVETSLPSRLFEEEESDHLA